MVLLGISLLYQEQRYTCRVGDLARTARHRDPPRASVPTATLSDFDGDPVLEMTPSGCPFSMAVSTCTAPSSPSDWVAAFAIPLVRSLSFSREGRVRPGRSKTKAQSVATMNRTKAFATGLFAGFPAKERLSRPAPICLWEL
jgi:hypothetical protein